MVKDKGHLGFRTPASDLQDEFNKLNALLTAKKIDWDEMGKKAESLKVMVEQQLMDTSKRSGAGIVSTFGFILSNQFTILSLIARLGAEIIETHESIARVEKKLK